MAFPWELNVGRPYRDEKWRPPQQPAPGESTDSALGDSTERLDGIPTDWEDHAGP